jgi:phosphoketolase
MVAYWSAANYLSVGQIYLQENSKRPSGSRISRGLRAKRLTRVDAAESDSRG